MKKLLGILVLSLLWCNVGFAEKIVLKCFNMDGSPYADPFSIDMDKRIVEPDFPFLNSSTKNYIKFVSFLDTEIPNAYTGLLIEIDLIENIALVIVEKVLKAQVRAFQSEPEKIFEDSQTIYPLKCERV